MSTSTRSIKYTAAAAVAGLVVWQFAMKQPKSNPFDSPTAAAGDNPKSEIVVGKSDYVMAGGTPNRNMVNLIDKGIPSSFDPAKGIKWKAQLGTRSYGGPVVAGGKIFCGTNNEHPRNQRDRGKPTEDHPLGRPVEKGILMCFDEETGKFLWQAVHDKFPQDPIAPIVGPRKIQARPFIDAPRIGTPIVEGNRIYYVSNRYTMVCADVNGFTNGNQGIKDEQYKDKTDADIIWELDMIKDLQVHPQKIMHCASAVDLCSPLIVGDLLFLITGNGVDGSPEAASFLCLNKRTGKIVWNSTAPGKGILHGQWSHPAYGVIHGVPQIIFPGGDGWLRAFEPETGVELWRFDVNPKGAKFKRGGHGDRNDFIAMPVIYKDRVYIGTGQDPTHSDGIGHFWCIEPGLKRGDLSPDLVVVAGKDPPITNPNPNSAVAWHFGGNDERPHAKRDYVFGRTMSTACIVDDICYITDLFGFLYALDAKTGKKYWQYDPVSAIFGSPYYVDGKIFVATDEGLFVFRHDPKPEVMDEIEIASRQPDEKSAKKAKLEMRQAIAKKYMIAKIEFDEPIYSTPIVANGVLYVMTEKTLFAVSTK